MRVRRALVVTLAALTATLAVGATLGLGKPGADDLTWTTIYKSAASIEGLTLDEDGHLYVPTRGGGAPCDIVRVDADGGPSQAGVVVARMNPPCNPAGLAFGPDGRLYVSGFGTNEIGVVTPSATGPTPIVGPFATDTPGANGLAFDEDGNLYVSDGGTAQGRVFRVGPGGGQATVLFRVPPMLNAAGVGRQNSPVAPGTATNPQNIVANGLAFDKKGVLYVADTARGALWKVELDRDGNLETPLGCDTTYLPDTLCLDALFVQHPALDGADGIALDRKGNIWVDANERNAVVVVDKHGRVEELFRNPPVANLRNGGPLEFPTSPVLAGRTFCNTNSDGLRRDNAPNTAGEAAPGTAVLGKVNCLNLRLDSPGLELPVD
jgi:sugar lactone lactonase YvrE